MQIMSTMASLVSLEGPNEQLESNASQHVMTMFRSDCNTSNCKWHIAKINHKSNAKCQDQQWTSNIKCTTKIARGKKRTLAPTYWGRKEDYRCKQQMVVDFWLCWDNIKWCVKGTKHKWVIDWLKVPEVWLILIVTKLNQEETLLL